METDLTRKAKALAGQLTLEEKIGMIHGAELFATKGVERLGIPPLRMSDSTMGVRQDFEPDSWQAIGRNDDYVTYLPCCSGIAATWNRKLAYEAGGVLGAEARGRGKDVILGPGVNIKRSPLCGRNFEYFSEDPYLTGELAAPFIRGVQEWDVAACVKHFAANNQETERLWVEVEVDEEVLRAIYLPAFYEAVSEGGALTIMGAYNQLYGEHCCQSDFLLKKVLREEWGYDGVVISDWGGVHDTELAARSQLDIEMSVTSDFDQYKMADPLKKMVEKGQIPESAVEEKVVRILMLMMRLHMMDGKRKTGCYNTEKHRRIVLQAARESVVLLKNEKGQLPLDSGKCRRILVIGENGDCTHADGGGSGEIKALYEITPLMGIRKLLGGNCQVDYVPGYCRDAAAAAVADREVPEGRETAVAGMEAPEGRGTVASDGEVSECKEAAESGGEMPECKEVAVSDREAPEGRGTAAVGMGTPEGGEAATSHGKVSECKEVAVSGKETPEGRESAASDRRMPEERKAAAASGAGKKKEEKQAVNWQAASLENGGGSVKIQKVDEAAKRHREILRRQAIEQALRPEYDQVIFVGGLNHDQDCEGNDRPDMKLPYDQDHLIGTLLEARPDMVVVLTGGSPVEMGQWIGRAHSLVWSWYAGMEGGTALAEVLFGKVNPSGKLPESFYKNHMDCSAHCMGEFPGTNRVCYKEGMFVGYRYLDTFGVEPEFCFGHGLSYTEFSYGKAEVITEQPDMEGSPETRTQVFLTCEITNTGTRAGKEIVQVYLGRKENDKKAPIQELAGFEKVDLEPGETKRVQIQLKGDVTGKHILVGSSSRDIRVQMSASDVS